MVLSYNNALVDYEFFEFPRTDYEYSFFNRSQHNLKSLQGDPDNLEEDPRDYVNAFLNNVRHIFQRYKFEETPGSG